MALVKRRDCNKWMHCRCFLSEATIRTCGENMVRGQRTSLAHPSINDKRVVQRSVNEELLERARDTAAIWGGVVRLYFRLHISSFIGRCLHVVNTHVCLHPSRSKRYFGPYRYLSILQTRSDILKAFQELHIPWPLYHTHFYVIFFPLFNSHSSAIEGYSSFSTCSWVQRLEIFSSYRHVPYFQLDWMVH